jgi:hypothetical protein
MTRFPMGIFSRSSADFLVQLGAFTRAQGQGDESMSSATRGTMAAPFPLPPGAEAAGLGRTKPAEDRLNTESRVHHPAGFEPALWT